MKSTESATIRGTVSHSFTRNDSFRSGSGLLGLFNQPEPDDGGWVLYCRVRNAKDLLGKLGMSDPATRPRRIAQLRRSGASLEALAYMGCAADDLSNAGFSDDQLRAHGVACQKVEHRNGVRAHALQPAPAHPPTLQSDPTHSL